MSLVGALSKIGATAKKTAPFYSAVDEALANLPRPKGTGAEFLRELSKTPGVKPAEIADRKLAKAFEAKGKMTKEEAIKLAREYPPPKLREEITNDLTDKQLAERADDIAQSWGYRDYDDLLPQFQREVDERLERMQNQYGYDKLLIPGGKNYREIKMKLPSFSEEDSQKLMKLEADQRRTDPDFWRNSGDAYRLRELQAKKAAMGEPYLSSHWKGEPNVLAHMRVSDRVGPDGQKILHVEEIQSDWHQEGRKKGYKIQGGELTSKEDNRLTELTMMNPEVMTDAENKELMSLMSRLPLSGSETIANKSRVPDAPFKKNWHELAMKRLLNYAADNGYDSIAITPGAEQAKRYDLSKQIDNVVVNPYRAERGEYSLQAVGKNGETVFDKNNVQLNELDDYIGKELADRARQQLIDKGTSNLSGVDLQVGGEGMKGFYDQMLPSYLNQFGKKHGAQVELHGHQVELKPKSSQPTYNFNGEQSGEVVYPEEVVKLHRFPITPTMREELTTKGTPLYQQIGIPTAGAGAASQMPQPEEGLAGGGIVNSLAKTEALAKLANLRQQMVPRAEAIKELMAKDSNQYLRDVTPNVLTNPEIEAEIARMKAKAEAFKPEVKKADGGAINYNTAPDMSDGGRIIQGAPFKRGGKVNMTTNRDTMFMELSNKKLKRK